MALKKNEKRLLLILGIAVLVFLFDRLVLSRKGAKPAPEARQQITGIVPAASAENLRSPALTGPGNGNKPYETWGHDPFIDSRASGGSKSSVAGAAKTSASKPLPELRGLLWKDGQAYVMLNDEIIKEGEEKQGLRIDKVEGKVVYGRRGNRSFTLYWSELP
jgi:hypothetical protein